MLADELDYVVGVDTHLDEHVLAVLGAPAGAVVAKLAVPANARGYREALRFVEEHADGERAWAVEGAGHYGAGLSRFLAGRGEPVLEVSRLPRAERRLRGAVATPIAANDPTKELDTPPIVGTRRQDGGASDQRATPVR